MIKENELLNNIRKLEAESAVLLKKYFNGDLAYIKKYVNTKKNPLKNPYEGGKVNTNFHNDEMPIEVSHCICLSVILSDFVL